MNTILNYVIPHAFGLIFITIGWYISILNVGLTRFTENVLITKWTLSGLGMIVVGAYLPEIWISIRNLFKRK
ncbi:hypothetical protein ACO2J1_16820 [Leptospira interrogans]|uniref:Uncharacterized protein n=20 Tax=Leptospira interrogans TaxID=173 RepID=Q8F8S2_LEPIN|nr:MULTISPECIES: hypothetical protein [Leptospira]APH40402.1 Uncharacterized protein A9P81_0449 [Leptospira interrogans serovar Copenhageni/Icterohaemorrhagiae]EMF44717.1 hypothetical protein LEP1GSC067_2774 [Leptospira interrogans serovar Lora str. TE 1992]EMF72425.1 hypothetical protein LEP1GSC148_3495 [Leptospira interrogans serovar Canicola str. LT1962]EMG19055.1 hypothetical protein LEP1GSC150_0066 [Leptospira interrogans serovar Copenhageni str. LT2050]EMM80337.1 hypothetical protein LEP